MKLTSHREIIDAWPDLHEFSLDMGERYYTVRGWRTRSSIPADRWKKVVQYAHLRQMHAVTETLLSDLIAKEATE